MNRIIILILLVSLFVTPVSAMTYTAPDVPDSVEKYMPDDKESFAEGLWYIIKKALEQFQPSLTEAAKVSLSIIAVILISSILRNFTSNSKRIADLVATLCVATTLVSSANSMIHLGTNTVIEVSEYGKLLIPVMTGALAAQGGTTSSAALYTGTVFFNAVLSSAISKLIVPMIYIYMVLCIVHSCVGEEIIKNLRNFIKWLITWSMKIVIYVFTGYLGITGVITGSTDAAALKVAKLTISGVVPVVGNIISDASETILVGVGVAKSAVGIYGLLAIWVGPFIKIGVQYLLMKLLAAICGAFGAKETVTLVDDFAGIMGFLVAMTGTVCLLLLISIVCFLKGVG